MRISVIPAQAGICRQEVSALPNGTPAFAGVTKRPNKTPAFAWATV